MFGWRMFLAYDLARFGHLLDEGSDRLNLRGEA